MLGLFSGLSFVCVEVLRPSQPIRVMLSAVCHLCGTIEIRLIKLVHTCVLTDSVMIQLVIFFIAVYFFSCIFSCHI